MDILSVSFAIFVIKLAFCIVPISLGIRLFTFSSEAKDDLREKISKKLLGDPRLVESGFFNLFVYSFGGILIFMGVIIGLLLILGIF